MNAKEIFIPQSSQSTEREFWSQTAKAAKNAKGGIIYPSVKICVKSVKSVELFLNLLRGNLPKGCLRHV